MGKMKKEDLEKMKRENPAENNWEVPDEEGIMKNEEKQDSGGRNQEPEAEAVVSVDTEGAAKAHETPEELKEVFSGIPADLPDCGQLKKRIHQDWLKVDPAVRTRNPVWKYSIKDDNMMRCTIFLFRSGQKVRIFTPAESQK